MRIAISGKKFSGKTTLANQLVQAVPNATRLRFAQPFKQGLALMGVDVDGPNKDVWLMQHIGALFRERYGVDHWVNLMARNVSEAESHGFEHVVIDDLRFQNEAEWCRKNGFLLVRLNTPGEVRLERARQSGLIDEDFWRYGNHQSEWDLDDWRDWDIEFFGQSKPADMAETIVMARAYSPQLKDLA